MRCSRITYDGDIGIDLLCLYRIFENMACACVVWILWQHGAWHLGYDLGDHVPYMWKGIYEAFGNYTSRVYCRCEGTWRFTFALGVLGIACMIAIRVWVCHDMSIEALLARESCRVLLYTCIT